MRRLLVRAALSLLALVLVGGCATAGDDAVQQGGEFTFVSPGGQTKIFYPQDKRGRVSNLSGSDLMDENKQTGLRNFDDKVVVLNIWGAWCGPCRSEAGVLQAVQAKTAPQGVQVLGVDVRDNQSAAQDFHRNRGLNYPSIFDASGRSLLALKGYPRGAVPSTIVLDRQHRVAAVYLTEVLQSDLLPEVQKVAAEPRS